jgi:hypothetical protein
MKLPQFFAALLPNFERSRIVEDLDMLRTEVKDNLLPAFKHAAQLTHGKPFKSSLVNNFNEVFVMTMPEYKRVGFIGGLLSFYTTLDDKLEIIDKMIPELFAKDVTKESITYRKASILQYLSAVRFINEYSARSLLRFLTAEQFAALGKDEQIDTQLAPAELKWLTENQQAYLQAIKVLSIPVKDLATALGQIPEISVVPERYELVAQSVGYQNLDPLKLGLISGNWNPIYHLRSLWVERQVEAYKRDKELKRALELKLLALKQAYDGKEDARLGQQIEYVEGRIAKLSQSIHEMEQHA